MRLAVASVRCGDKHKRHETCLKEGFLVEFPSNDAQFQPAMCAQCTRHRIESQEPLFIRVITRVITGVITLPLHAGADSRFDGSIYSRWPAVTAMCMLRV